MWYYGGVREEKKNEKRNVFSVIWILGHLLI